VTLSIDLIAQLSLTTAGLTLTALAASMALGQREEVGERVLPIISYAPFAGILLVLDSLLVVFLDATENGSSLLGVGIVYVLFIVSLAIILIMFLILAGFKREPLAHRPQTGA